jgi:primosomal protein N' (replication factor Y)
MTSPRPRAVPLWEEPASATPAAAVADVALDVGGEGHDQVFTYAVPPELVDRVRAGARVRVPFAGRRQPLVGVVLAVRGDAAGAPARLKPVLAACDAEPLLGPHELRLARFLAERTCSGIGRALRPLLPPGEDGGGPRTLPGYFPAEGLDAAEARERLGRAPAQRHAWDAIRAEPGLTLAELGLRGCGPAAVAALVRRGLVVRRPVERAPGHRLLPAAAEPAAGRDAPPEPTADQARAVAAVVAALGTPRAILLHGVTGSGKTEVYLQAIAQALARGGQALVLVPEIALTPQTVARFRARFGEDVAVLHSGLSVAERRAAWWRLRRGEARVAVGARSAVFAPLQRLALIVVDEEHEASYRQEEAPRYHARDVALWRGQDLGIPVVLGSATPDLGTYAMALEGRIGYLALPTRVGGRPLPAVRVVDRRVRAAAAPEGTRSALFGPELVEAIDRHLAQGGQVLLFLNRRGFAPVLLCGACGFTARCQACSVSLCYHEADRRLRCHYCGARRPVPAACPVCGGHLLRLAGAGTERVAAEVARLWPAARVLRMDADSTQARGAHARIYHAFRAGEADVLVGTQMVAKGWDVRGVTLVGVVDADTALHRPDYRSAERTFQLLYQVAGRAGRGEQPGEVLVQTYCPDHPAVAWAAAHDFEAFARAELAVRRQAGFPPYGHLVRLLAWDPRAAEAEAAARALHRALLEEGIPPGVDVWGPGPAPLARVRGQYRYQIALRGSDGAALRALATRAYRRVARARPAAHLAVDPDPLSML